MKIVDANKLLLYCVYLEITFGFKLLWQLPYEF